MPGSIILATTVTLVLSAFILAYNYVLSTLVLIVITVASQCLLWSVSSPQGADSGGRDEDRQEPADPDARNETGQEMAEPVAAVGQQVPQGADSPFTEPAPRRFHEYDSGFSIPDFIYLVPEPADQFPSPTGSYSTASRLPWRLPEEPSPPGITADCVRIGNLEARAASIVGPGHRCEEPGTARQDAYRIGRDTEGRYLLVAVADGMSDSAHSHLGANVAATALVNEMRGSLERGVTPEKLDAVSLFLEAARQMVGAASQRGILDMDVRTALLAAVIPATARPDGRRKAWLASVGDVSAWRRNATEWEQLVGKEKSGMDAHVLSEFLPYHPNNAIASSIWLEGDDVLALTTDGIADVLSPPGRAAAWFAHRWRCPPNIASFLLDVGYDAKAQMDDRTAVVLWCGIEGDEENEVLVR